MDYERDVNKNQEASIHPELRSHLELYSKIEKFNDKA
jgi:hypothetical protein